jgi:hypothetical protein
MPYILGIVVATIMNPLIVDLYYIVRQSPNTGIWTTGRCNAIPAICLYVGALCPVVGIAAAVATLFGYTSGFYYGFSLRVLYSGSLFGLFTRNYCTHILSIYMGPVARQVDYQAT